MKKNIMLTRVFALLYLVLNTTFTISAYCNIKYYSHPASSAFGKIFWLVVSQIAFVIYLFAFCKKKPEHVLLPISYILLLIHHSNSFIQSYILNQDYFNNITRYMTPSNFPAMFMNMILPCLYNLFIIGVTIFFIVICFTKFKKIRPARCMIIIYTSVSLLHYTYMLIRNIYQFNILSNTYMELDFFTGNLLGLLATATVYFHLISHFVLWMFVIQQKEANA